MAACPVPRRLRHSPECCGTCSKMWCQDKSSLYQVNVRCISPLAVHLIKVVPSVMTSASCAKESPNCLLYLQIKPDTSIVAQQVVPNLELLSLQTRVQPRSSKMPRSNSAPQLGCIVLHASTANVCTSDRKVYHQGPCSHHAQHPDSSNANKTHARTRRFNISHLVQEVCVGRCRWVGRCRRWRVGLRRAGRVGGWRGRRVGCR
jgi:hypothetical protein